MTSELDIIERYLRETAATRAVENADNYGWAEVAPGVHLNTAEYMIEDQAGWHEYDQAKGMDFSTSPYWMTADNGATPEPIASAQDEDLRSAVDVSADMNRAAENIDIRDSMARGANQGKSAGEDLASPEQAMARRSRGRVM